VRAAAAVGLGGRDFGAHSLTPGGLTTGMGRGEHPARSSVLGSANLSDVTVISSEQMLPAACQGIIAVTVRQGDGLVSNFLATTRTG
jgi:hypothetical protein